MYEVVPEVSVSVPPLWMLWLVPESCGAAESLAVRNVFFRVPPLRVVGPERAPETAVS